MTATYVLASAAEADLRDVIRYTRKQWGDAQTRMRVLPSSVSIAGHPSGTRPIGKVAQAIEI